MAFLNSSFYLSLAILDRAFFSYLSLDGLDDPSLELLSDETLLCVVGFKLT